MNEHMIPLVMFLAMNAALCVGEWIKYIIEERREHENIVSKPLVARFGSRFQRN